MTSKLDHNPLNLPEGSFAMRWARGDYLGDTFRMAAGRAAYLAELANPSPQHVDANPIADSPPESRCLSTPN